MTKTQDTRRSTRHGFWFGIAAGIALGAVVAGAAVSAAPLMVGKAFQHGLAHGGAHDAAALHERASFAARFVLERVDATEAQHAEVERIVSDTVAELIPLGVEHRAHREALHEALLQTEVDAGVIERIREQEMALAEQASRRVSAALSATAQALTAEQRIELAELAHRFHR